MKDRTYRLTRLVLGAGCACLAVLLVLVWADAGSDAFDALGTIAAWMLGGGAAGAGIQGARHVKPTLPPTETP
jgi:hypothetical protein